MTKHARYSALVAVFLSLFLRGAVVCWAGQDSAQRDLDSVFTMLTGLAQKIDDPFTKSEGLLHLSLVCIDMEDYPRGQAILSDALQGICAIEDDACRSIALFEITAAYVRLGLLADASAVAQQIEYPDSQAEAFWVIMKRYIEDGHCDQATSMAALVSDQSARPWILYWLMDEYLQRGLYKELADVERLIDGEPVEARKLINIISMTAERQRYRKDIAMRNLVPSANAGSKTDALIAMAEENIASGLMSRVSELLKEIRRRVDKDLSSAKAWYTRDRVLARMAECYVKMKDYETARSTIDAIGRTPNKSEPLAALAVSLAEDGDCDAALRETRLIESEFSREKVYRSIVHSYLDAGRFDDAVSLVGTVPEASSRSRLYRSIISCCLELKDYTRAFVLAARVEDELTRIQAISDIVKYGYHDDAMFANLTQFVHD